MNKVIYPIIVSLILSLSVNANSNETAKKEVQIRLSNLENIIIKTNSVNGLWRNTTKILDHCKQAIDSGDYKEANKLLDSAQFEAEQGYIQATKQQDLDKIIPHYLK